MRRSRCGQACFRLALVGRGRPAVRSALRLAAVALAFLSRLKLRKIGGAEVDAVEQEGREARILRRFSDDLAGEREQQARSLDQEEGPKGLFREVAKSEQPAVAQLDHELDAAVRPGRNVELDHDLVNVVRDPLDVDVELHVDARLVLPLEHVWCVRILNREIFDVLRKGRGLRAGIRVTGAVSGRKHILIGHRNLRLDRFGIADPVGPVRVSRLAD
jgi:hypothetical protein